MLKPEEIVTKIFIDTGDPNETRSAIEKLGFLDGQTTNPSLVAKLRAGEAKLTREQALNFYKEHVKEVSSLIPEGSVSIEVYADANTTSEDMVNQAHVLNTWIPNAHIKLPLLHNGLVAARQLLDEGMRLNITLCFSQEQALAVFRALEKAKPGQVFLSPFVGRLDDKGVNGMDLIKNIITQKQEIGSEVEVLTASVRTIEHFMYAIKLGTNIITSPYKIIEQWANEGTKIPDEDYTYATDLQPIEYLHLDSSKNWDEYNIQHELTDTGIAKFVEDWNSMITP